MTGRAQACPASPGQEVGSPQPPSPVPQSQCSSPCSPSTPSGSQKNRRVVWPWLCPGGGPPLQGEGRAPPLVGLELEGCSSPFPSRQGRVFCSCPSEPLEPKVPRESQQAAGSAPSFCCGDSPWSEKVPGSALTLRAYRLQKQGPQGCPSSFQKSWPPVPLKSKCPVEWGLGGPESSGSS